MYCVLSTASEVFHIFTTQLYQYFSVCYFLLALLRDKSEVFLPEYSQPAILHAAHVRRVVNSAFFYLLFFRATFQQCQIFQWLFLFIK